MSQLPVFAQPGRAPDLKVQKLVEQHSRLQSGHPSEGGPTADSAVAEPVDPALGPLRSCLERSDKACAFAVFAKLQDPKLKDTPEYLNLAAQVLALKGSNKEALGAINRAIGIKPNAPSFYVTQGRIYQGLKAQPSAIRSFLQAAELQPKWPVPLYDLGMSFFLLGIDQSDTTYYDRAERHFNAALELDPKFHKAEFMLGIVDMFEWRLPSAKEHLENALKMSPQNPYYSLYYGVLLNRMADNAGALKEMELAEKIDPSYALAFSVLGRLQARLGNYTEARKQLETAVRLDPHFSSSYYSLGQVYHHLGLSKMSEVAFQKFRDAKAQEEQANTDPVDAAMSSSDLRSSGANPDTAPK